MMKSPQLPTVKYEMILLGGGLDQVTPTLDLKPGIIRYGINFECSTNGGYSRVNGYERLDGRPSPSSASFIILTVSGSTSPALGSTITGAISSSTGVLIAKTATTFVITKVSGTFNGTENLTVSSIVVGTQTGFGSNSTQKQFAQYKALAADNYRADIQSPPGSGPVRGVFMHNGDKFCFRDNAGATDSILYKATTSGWTIVQFAYEVSFTAASSAPAEGASLVQGLVSATVQRVVLQSGAYLGGTAAGRMIIGATSGGNFSAGAFTGGMAGTCSGAQTAITMLPGGKFDFEESNFKGQAVTSRVYGCDGINRGFEFDGSVFVPIVTGTSPDTPVFVAAHKKHLFFAFGSSIIHSAPGLPYDFQSADGSSEIATGDTVTGMLVQPGAQTTGSMAVFNRTTTSMLYGTGVSSWNFVAYNTGTGAVPWSCQNMSQSYFLDNFGIMGLTTSLNFGNFDQSTLTNNIRPFISDKKSLTTCSTLCRKNSQYRIYFSDGSGLHLTMINPANTVSIYIKDAISSSNYLGAIPIYYPIGVGTANTGIYNIWEGSDPNGNEVILACGADGMVYQLEKGTSFDGANIDASITLNFDSVKSPRVLKRFRKAALEISGSSYAEIDLLYTLGYGRNEFISDIPATYNSNMIASNWDKSNWDQFFWDSTDIAPVECEMNGSSENVAINLSSSTNYMDSYTINSIIIHYTPRRGLR